MGVTGSPWRRHRRLRRRHASAWPHPADDLIADGRFIAVRLKVRVAASAMALIYPLSTGILRAASQNWKDGLGWEDWHYSNGTDHHTGRRRSARRSQPSCRPEEAAAEERQRLAEAARQRGGRALRQRRPSRSPTSLSRQKQVKPHGLRQSRQRAVGTEVRHGHRRTRQPAADFAERRKAQPPGGRVDGTWFIFGKPEARGTSSWARVLPRPQLRTKSPATRRRHLRQPDNLMTAAIELRKAVPAGAHRRSGGRRLEEDGQPRPDGGEEAARAVDAFLAVPTVRTTEQDDDTDFNDMCRLVGADAVKAAIENAAKPPDPNGNDKAAADQALEMVAGAARSRPTS